MKSVSQAKQRYHHGRKKDFTKPEYQIIMHASIQSPKAEFIREQESHLEDWPSRVP